jgi:hypothetical protein
MRQSFWCVRFVAASRHPPPSLLAQPARSAGHVDRHGPDAGPAISPVAVTSIITMGQPFISKSKYLWGFQCHKLLWHAYNAKDLIPEPDAAQQAVFDQGHEVGALAKQLGPDGIEVTSRAEFWGVGYCSRNSANHKSRADEFLKLRPCEKSYTTSAPLLLSTLTASGKNLLRSA